MVQIRKALAKDLDAINELTLEMHNYLGALVGIKFSMEELKEEMFETEKDLKTVYVAELNRKVIGYMAFSEKVEENEFFGEYYHLYHIVVKRGYRRKGIGLELFSVLLRKATQENVNVVAGTFCLDKEALRFYRKVGFQPIETVLILDNTKRLRIPQ